MSIQFTIIYKVDATSLWPVFSKCADLVQNGRRLEYMCWRYWNRSNKSLRPEDPEKLFSWILKEEQPLLPPLARRKSAVTADLQRSGSTTTGESTNTFEDSSEVSQLSLNTQSTQTTVIRGFSPAKMPKAADSAATPAKETPAPPQRSTGTTVFQIGTSGSSEEEGSMRGNLQKSRPVTFLNQRRQSQQLHIPASRDDCSITDHSETDFDECAIDDDDDDSDWEDSDEVSGQPRIDEKTYFKRVDSSANLVSRRSLLTLGLEANERQWRLGNVTSHSTSAIHRPRAVQHVPGVEQAVAEYPNDSDGSPLMMKGARQGPLKPIREAPRTAAQPIMMQGPSGYYQAALSPRTTRRHMLAKELTESLRRHLLCERQQKSSTANAVLKRRHTSHDVANL